MGTLGAARLPAKRERALLRAAGRRVSAERPEYRCYAVAHSCPRHHVATEGLRGPGCALCATAGPPNAVDGSGRGDDHSRRESAVTTEKDEFYRDILEGMAIYAGNAFQRDVLATVSRHDEPAIGAALNKNQIESKMWLADSLLDAVGPDLRSVVILGGWFGVLGAVLLHDSRFAIGKVVSIDIDPRCAAIAESLNATHVRTARFSAQTADMLEMDYAPVRSDDAGAHGTDLVINTSCEHLREFGRWYDRIPAGQLLVLQSNDYYSCNEHVNCVPDLATLRAQAPMRDVLFAGQRSLRRYVRFMLIGKK